MYGYPTILPWNKTDGMISCTAVAGTLGNGELESSPLITVCS